jgi:hypothetical protein
LGGASGLPRLLPLCALASFGGEFLAQTLDFRLQGFYLCVIRSVERQRTAEEGKASQYGGKKRRASQRDLTMSGTRERRNGCMGIRGIHC